MRNRKSTIHKHTSRISNTYLVVFVGGVVLEQDDALAVQAPVVPLSLSGIKVGEDGTAEVRHNTEEHDG